ncbi:MAG: zinc ribbon domain-containing protein [Acidobacteriota bacterium]
MSILSSITKLEMLPDKRIFLTIRGKCFNIIFMPIYEFSCNECNEKFEVIILKSDQIIECPKCKGKSLKKLYSPFGIAGGDKFESSVSSSNSCSSCKMTSCSTCD